MKKFFLKKINNINMFLFFFLCAFLHKKGFASNMSTEGLLGMSKDLTTNYATPLGLSLGALTGIIGSLSKLSIQMILTLVFIVGTGSWVIAKTLAGEMLF